MGGPYLVDIANMAFKGQSLKKLPFVRLGCMAVNLLTHKVEHDIGMCFQKSDLTWIQNPTNYAAVDAFESSAMQLDEWLESMVVEGQLGENDRCNIMFKFLIRNCLHLRQKEKLGYEKKVFNNSAEIRSAAASDIQKITGGVGHCKWQPMAVTTGGECHQPKAGAQRTPAAAADLNSEAKVLENKGFTVGKQVLECGATPLSGLYAIAKISDGKVVLEKETFGGLQRAFSVELTAIEFAQKFKAVADAAKLPIAMSTSASTRHVRSRSHFVHDWARCRAWRTISSVAIGSCIDDGACFIYMCNPKKLFTKRAFEPKQLQIVPSTTLDGIRLDEKMKCVNSMASITVYLDDDGEAVDLHFVLAAPPTSSVNEPTKWDEKVTFEPYWWMASTSDEKLATVTKQMVCKDGVVFPTFVNNEALGANAEIMYFTPKKESAPKTSLEERATAMQDRCPVPTMRRKRFKQAP
eukprot:7410042-Pyramimonas_sp.AAC.1